MDSFFFRKHMALLMTKKGGTTSSYFSYRKTDLCGVATGYAGSKSFILANQTADKNGRIY